MGVRRSDWVVLGVNIGMDNYYEDNYDFYDKYDERKEKGEITFIIDGMSEEYFVVGELIAYGDVYNGLGLKEIEIDPDKYKKSSERVKTFIKKEFNLEDVEDPKLIILTHFA